ncbi:purine nucleosidase [Rhizobium sp. SG_E_25_P2]|uniref:nucleoside hydrolase n=1 Tax=Rhizobium sp. SG_E_25_P2 TaxID=2879942 RepID=UPI00247415B6|nr:nucleoside hydrolase [Rhizobium sp. SG_E_25_P2]MDH6266196.1 purine nucleosidase [Rhizobium sp. SG_E_25_P2]
MSARRLILDTDGGVDDAQALMMLAGAGRPPFAVTTVFGNVDLDTATDNILAVLATLTLEPPVYKGAIGPLIGRAVNAADVHGEDGLGGAPRPTIQARAECEHAVDFLRRSLKDAAKTGDLIDLLMIGPLTNLALALRLDPTIADGIGRLTIMGGTREGRGNITPAAEFNIYADPEAAEIVFSAGMTITLVPWESCLAHSLTGETVDALYSIETEAKAARLSLALARHLRANAIRRGRGDRMFFVDPLAAAVVVEPEAIMTSWQAAVEIELAQGPARGMTIVDPAGRTRKTTVRIVETVDAARLEALYARSIAPDDHK